MRPTAVGIVILLAGCAGPPASDEMDAAVPSPAAAEWPVVLVDMELDMLTDNGLGLVGDAVIRAVFPACSPDGSEPGSWNENITAQAPAYRVPDGTRVIAATFDWDDAGATTDHVVLATRNPITGTYRESDYVGPGETLEVQVRPQELEATEWVFWLCLERGTGWLLEPQVHFIPGPVHVQIEARPD